MAKRASSFSSKFSSKKFNVFLMLLLIGVTAVTLVTLQQQQELRSNAQTANPSGLPWLSGVYTEGVSDDAFAAWRGRPIDLTLGWVARQTWSDISQPDTWSVLSSTPSTLKLATGMAMLPEDGSGNYQQCAAGAYDQYYKTAGQNYVKAGRGDVFVRLGWEANGNWFAWSMGTDLTNYKACFRREVQAMKSTAPNLKIDWNMNKGNSDTSFNITDAYPGDDVVDVVGVDFYDNWPAYPNQAAWDADYMSMNNGGGPSGIGAWLQFAKQHGKKLSVPEWGLNNLGGDPNQGGGADDVFYIQSMFNFFNTNAADIAYESYFNTQNSSFIIDPPGINPNGSAKYQELWKAGAGSTQPAPSTVSPTFVQLAPCPTCVAPTSALGTVAPTNPVTVTSPIPTVAFTPSTIPTPCPANTGTASVQHKRRLGSGGSIWQFFLQLINMLLQLLGRTQLPVPSNPAPAPNPGPVPCISP